MARCGCGGCRVNKPELIALIQSVSETILAQSPGSVVRIRLLRDVLGKPPEDTARVDAQSGLVDSRWVRELAAEQWADGGWGAFHSENTRRKQVIPTTEAGVERALALGLESTHPIVDKAKNYLVDILQGQKAFPDRPEKNNRWATGVRLFTAATLARIEPEHPELEEDRQLWGQIARRTFQSGSYNEDDEARAHAELTGASVKGSYLRMRGKYQLTLLGSILKGLPPDVEKACLTWLWQLQDGIGYLSVPLHLPPADRSGVIDRWLASHELLGQYFPNWASLAAPVVDWLLSKQGADGTWDFGPRPDARVNLPLSDSWRARKHRKMDWSVRVLMLLKRYVDGICALSVNDDNP
jgi:hypothetical protein